ncbi:uncharacterized protein HD556DRAFT_297641 [Suillus plorans]|uniref:Uncharacterized protein n=1 Tax=Suillus plorans TaxID=116603 RepID=A0A9P7ATM0_9AGAM|nr:uncharacterized protein HD556DRAFT_297641 [Suillus plorans]KAG1796379.1 hypothetical protein HD556DRAFT_297641 [Suillus plorans]
MQVIMMIRIHAMYGRSKKMLVFLVIVLLASTISSICFTAITGNFVSVDDFSGYYMCYPTYFDEGQPMNMQVESVRLMSTAIWEILAFVLAVRIVIKHFRELRYSPTGPTIGDCFMVLTKSHTFYFVGFLVVLCFSLTSLFTYLPWTESGQNYSGVFQIAQELQMFVLGPRLILSIREYHAELVARSDEGTGMTTIHFQAGGDASTGGDV